MIRFLLKERIADKEFVEKRRVTLDEIAKETGISRNTLSRISNQHGYNTTTDVIDRLCDYFGCPTNELIEHVSTGERRG